MVRLVACVLLVVLALPVEGLSSTGCPRPYAFPPFNQPGEVVPKDAVFCVGTSVAFPNRQICWDEGVLCYWGISGFLDKDTCGDPWEIDDGWCAAFSLSGTDCSFEEGAVTFNAPGQGVVGADVDDAGDPGEPDSEGPLPATPTNYYVIGGDYTVQDGDGNEFRQLRYYCEAGVPGRYKARLIAAPNQPNGVAYLWQVEDGPARITYGATEATAGLEATGWSYPGGIVVALKYRLNGHECTARRTFTAYQPYYVVPNGIIHSAYEGGFWTNYYWRIFHQLDAIMDDIDINEVNSNKTCEWSDCDNYNWTLGYQGGDHTSTGEFKDSYYQAFRAWLVPLPQPPQDPLGAERVDRFHQEYFCGSPTPGQGCNVESHTVRRFRDHAEVTGEY